MQQGDANGAPRTNGIHVPQQLERGDDCQAGCGGQGACDEGQGVEEPAVELVVQRAGPGDADKVAGKEEADAAVGGRAGGREPPGRSPRMPDALAPEPSERPIVPA